MNFIRSPIVKNSVFAIIICMLIGISFFIGKRYSTKPLVAESSSLPVAEFKLSNGDSEMLCSFYIKKNYTNSNTNPRLKFIPSVESVSAFSVSLDNVWCAVSVRVDSIDMSTNISTSSINKAWFNLVKPNGLEIQKSTESEYLKALNEYGGHD
jgi:hypothetical protein